MESGFNVTYNKEHNCLLGKGFGVFSIEMIEPYIAKIDKMATEYKCRRFVNDLSMADIKFSVSELFFTPPKVVARNFDRNWVRAIVVKKITDDWSFYETTALNQGLKVKIFTSLKDAYGWMDY